jgi:hypothetical protein
MKKKSFGLILAALLLSFASQAKAINSESVKSSTLKKSTLKKSDLETKQISEKRLTFSKSTESKEIILNLDSIAGKRCVFFMVNVMCDVSYGKISVEVFTPDNNVINNFALEGGSRSHFTKTYQLPKTGIWKVRIVAENATANISINTNAMYIEWESR